jgi:5-deoxy-glucuronate isomerase
MSLHVTDHRKGFALGLTEITRFEDPGEPTGLSFAVLKLAAGESTKIETKHETAWLLMQGSAEFTAGNQTRQFERRSCSMNRPVACTTRRASASISTRLATANSRSTAAPIARISPAASMARPMYPTSIAARAR